MMSKQYYRNGYKKYQLDKHEKQYLITLTTIFTLTIIILSFITYTQLTNHGPESGSTNNELSTNYSITSYSTKTNLNKDNQDTRGSRVTLDTWGLWDPELVDPDEPNGQTIYAQYRQYTFRFVVDPVTTFANVTSLTINIPDEVSNYTWTRSRSMGEDSRDGKKNSNNSDISENSDKIVNQNEDNSRTSTRSDYNVSFYLLSSELGYLDFNITFGWFGFNSDISHLWKIIIVDDDSNTTEVKITMNYKIIRTLEFTGNLMVEAQQQRVLNELDWVRSAENINWSGLRVIYSSSANIVPLKNQARIVLYNNDKDKWENTAAYGDLMFIQSSADSKNDLSDKHEITIYGPAMPYLIESIYFTLRVDGDGVNFFNPIPEQDTWMTEKAVTCGIIVSDNETSGVKKDSIEFKYSTNGGNDWLGWYKPKIINKNGLMECTSNINFQDGANNVIQWQGRDIAGNPFNQSKIYSVNVDATQLTFRNPLPSQNQFQYTKNLTCSVLVEDQFSGVNASSIQYSVLLDGEINWSSWQDLELIENKSQILASARIIYPYGEANFIQWRAKDVAGNGFTLSNIYQYKITHQKLEITLNFPSPGMVVNATMPTFSWEEPYEMLQTITYTLEYWLEGMENNKVELDIGSPIGANFTLDDPLEYDKKYYWRIITETDKKDGTGKFESEIRHFTINSYENINPSFNFDAALKSDDKIDVNPGDKLNVGFTIFNMGNQRDVFHLELIVDSLFEGKVKISNNITVDPDNSTEEIVVIQVPEKLKNKSYVIKIVITSQGAQDQGKIRTDILTIELYPQSEGEPFDFIFENMIILIFIIAIIIILALIIILFHARKRYKKIQDTFGDSGKEAEVIFSPERVHVVDRTVHGRVKPRPPVREETIPKMESRPRSKQEQKRKK